MNEDPADTSNSQPNTSVAQTTHSESNEITWTASEYIAHSKGTSWYIVYALLSIIVCVVAYFIADEFTTILLAIMAVLFGIVAARKPRELQYKIDNSGILIDKKMYPYSGFKSFSIIQEEGIESIWFMPLQRFMPGLSIYFAPQDGQKIVDYLGNHLPYEERKMDFVDKIMHRIRF